MPGSHPVPGTQDPAPDDSHLVLVGLPGVGKTSVGRRAAELLGREFLDLDEEIVRRTGLPIPRLFAEAGEAAFRALELEVTRELVSRPAAVVAPGGGWVAQPAAVATLRPRARIIYLRAQPATVLVRMGRTVADRPLLAGGDPLDALRELLGRREDAYLSADHVLDTENLDLEEVARLVAALAGERRAG